MQPVQNKKNAAEAAFFFYKFSSSVIV